MSAGSSRLSYCLKTLREHWYVAQEKWADRVARDFEKNHLFPVEQQATTAIRGMEKLGEIMSKIRADIKSHSGE